MMLSEQRAFNRFWASSSISAVGSYIRLLALQILVVQNLHGTPLALGLMNAARWLPYLLMGLLAGAVLDRVDRRPVLVAADFVLMALYAAVGVLTYFGYLNIGWLMVMVFMAGGVTLFHDAASQAIVSQLVPGPFLLPANVRLEQSGSAAQTVGPAAAGALIGAIGAPLAILCDALGHLASGIVNAFIKPRPLKRAPRAHLDQDVKEGLRWVYRHPYLRVMAWNTNLWFLFHSMVLTVLVPFALHQLGFHALSLGMVLAGAGFGSFLGTLVSTWAEAQWGIGRAIAVARLLYAPSLILLALAPSRGVHAMSLVAFAMVAAGQGLYGLAMGIEGPLEMVYRQAVTPPHLQGRMNTTMRAANRAVVVVGAPLGGAMAVAFGVRAVLWLAVLGMAAVATWYRLSPMHGATLPEMPGQEISS